MAFKARVPAMILAACLAPLSVPAAASSDTLAAQGQPPRERHEGDPFARFVPRTSDPEHRIDYAVWGEALSSMVVGLGPSLRKAAPRPTTFINTRLLRGHTSPLRLEGSRVVFSLLNEEVIASLTAYREDLERVGTELDIPSLSRNEQLAFWLNLHNVAVIEQIARAYPVIIPSKIMIDGEALHDARFIEVAGVTMSLRDIRTRIVYPNWSDPRVIYGFWHGDIGGPLLQPIEFTGDNLDTLLHENATEFVNSLRGVELRGNVLHVSTLYSEARPFYFRSFRQDLYPHLAQFAKQEVAADLARAGSFRATIWEDDIADLARGQRQFVMGPVTSVGRSAVNYNSKTPLNVQRFMIEHRNKREILRRRGEPIWSITITPADPTEDREPVPEIK